MSLRKYKNPVNNHFIYNDDTRKSTCKICYFDMAGRHSENLMRHLKRKHPATYAEVMSEKHRRQSAARRPKQESTGTQSDNSATDCPLSSMFKFETEPHKLFIKTEKLTFRLDEPGHHEQPMPLSEQCSNDYEEDESNHTENAPFESVYIAKAELGEDTDQTSVILNDSGESYQDDGQIGDNPFNMPQLAPSAGVVAILGKSPNSSSSAMAPTTATATPTNNPDDAFFLQYLAHKFSKYSEATRNTVQFNINRILYKADMGVYEKPDVSKMSDTDI